MKDKLGREIKVGDFTVYGHLLSRSAGLRIGRVLRVEERPEPCREHERFRIRVQGVAEDAWGQREPARLCKPGTILFPDRVIVLDSLPDAYACLLASDDTGGVERAGRRPSKSETGV